MEYIGRLLELFNTPPQSIDPLDAVEEQQQQSQQDRAQSDVAFVAECNAYCMLHFKHPVVRDTDLLLGAVRLDDCAWGFPLAHPLAKAMQAHRRRHGDLDFPVRDYISMRKRFGKSLVIYADDTVERCVEAVCEKFEQHTENALIRKE